MRIRCEYPDLHAECDLFEHYKTLQYFINEKKRKQKKTETDAALPMAGLEVSDELSPGWLDVGLAGWE